MRGVDEIGRAPFRSSEGSSRTFIISSAVMVDGEYFRLRAVAVGDFIGNSNPGNVPGAGVAGMQVPAASTFAL